MEKNKEMLFKIMKKISRNIKKNRAKKVKTIKPVFQVPNNVFERIFHS